ncbi:MAG: hypothetical protein ACRD5F_04265 [Candidatus Acidiferrales bacterium]
MPYAIRSRGYLPHLQGDHPTYFVTFRLTDSLPREVLRELRQERERLERAQQAGTQAPADAARQEKLRALLRKAERWLDRGLGACHMRDPRVAKDCCRRSPTFSRAAL